MPWLFVFHGELSYAGLIMSPHSVKQNSIKCKPKPAGVGCPLGPSTVIKELSQLFVTSYVYGFAKRKKRRAQYNAYLALSNRRFISPLKLFPELLSPDSPILI